MLLQYLVVGEHLVVMVVVQGQWGCSHLHQKLFFGVHEVKLFLYGLGQLFHVLC